MNNTDFPAAWKKFILQSEVATIENDVLLFKNRGIPPVPDYPFKNGMTTAIICLRGSIDGLFNMVDNSIVPSTFCIILGGQTIQVKRISDDFEGLFIMMSSPFLTNLFSRIEDVVPLRLSVNETPIIPLDSEALNTMIMYYNMLHEVVGMRENPHRLEIVKHLMLAFFYHNGAQLHNLTDKEGKNTQELLLSKFLDVVQQHFKEERSVNFYADKLCLTPKYLTTVVRQSSGRTASDWIDNLVILEAQALLKSTNMTVQQVSEALNFPSQSFFGKYFRRHIGLSPSVYKKK